MFQPRTNRPHPKQTGSQITTTIQSNELARILGQSHSSVEVAVHSANVDTITILYPGKGGGIDGFRDKYVKLCNHLLESGSAAVRVANPVPDESLYGQSVVARLQTVIDYTLANAENICGRKDPSLRLFSISAGCGAAGMLAHTYPEIDSILMVAPSGRSMGWDAMFDNLSKFKGEVFVMVGENDEDVGSKVADQIQRGLRRTKF